MKYPKEQFEQLKSAIKTLSDVLPVCEIHPSRLHGLVYQQGSKGQKHNWIYQKDGQLARAHAIADLTGWSKVVDVSESFTLYPEGCNDDHIQTAVKAALKQIAN